MSDESEQDPPVPAPPLVPPAQQQAHPPFPAEGQTALHYGGTETLHIEGLTFAPDSILTVPLAVATRLAGQHHLRIVHETAEHWPHFHAMRARAKARQSG